MPFTPLALPASLYITGLEITVNYRSIVYQIMQFNFFSTHNIIVIYNSFYHVLLSNIFINS